MVSISPRPARPRPGTVSTPEVTAIRTLSERPCAPALSPLIGREGDLAALAGWLSEPHLRLITITGPGGVGKTSLAAEVARSVRERSAARVEVIPLAAISDPELLPATIGRALRGTTPNTPALVAMLDRVTQTTPLLLLLDNFEHLLDGALVVGEMLAGCPSVRIIVTSRERLRLRGEHEYVLDPLGVPPAETGAATDFASAVASPAVTMFVERMREVRAGFRLDPGNAGDIAELCRRLDGLPLALELAAARTKALPLSFLVARLDHSLALFDRGARDQVDRHQTLSAVAAWSYALLTPDEQRTFRRLSALPGAFPLAAALAVCTGDPEPAGGSQDRAGPDPDDLGAVLGMLNQLTSLVDKSLLNQAPSDDRPGDEPWFTMLETLRQFGLERLRDEGEEADTRGRHARWVVAAIVGASSPAPSASVPPIQFRFCAVHLPAIRAALSWLEATGDLGSLVLLATRVEPFWMLRSFRTEGIAWCQRILAHPAFSDLPAVDRGGIWLIAANLARTQAMLPYSMRCGEEALAAFAAVDHPLGIAATENLLGAVARTGGDLERARHHAQRAMDLFEPFGDAHWRALTRCNLGAVLVHAGEVDRAHALLLESEALYRGEDNAWGIGTTLVNLAIVARAQRRYGDAIQSYREAFRIFETLRPRESLLDVVSGIAVIAGDCGLHADALRLLAAIEVNRAVIAYHLEAPYAVTSRQTANRARAALTPNVAAGATVAGECLSFAALIAAADSLLDRIDRCLVEGSTGSEGSSLTPAGRLAIRFGLTQREIEVLGLIAVGISDREIGDRLFISPRTAMRHVANILLKLGVSSRTAAASLFLRESAT